MRFVNGCAHQRHKRCVAASVESVLCVYRFRDHSIESIGIQRGHFGAHQFQLAQLNLAVALDIQTHITILHIIRGIRLERLRIEAPFKCHIFTLVSFRPVHAVIGKIKREVLRRAILAAARRGQCIEADSLRLCKCVIKRNAPIRRLQRCTGLRIVIEQIFEVLTISTINGIAGT